MLLGTIVFVLGLVATFLSSWFAIAGLDVPGPPVVRGAGLLMAWVGLYLANGSAPSDAGQRSAEPAASRRRRIIHSVSAGTVIWLLPFGVSLLTFDSLLGLVPVAGSAIIIAIAGR
jgi:hypothetical protein